MDEKELLELAAKAVGRTLHYNYLGGQDCNRSWYPNSDYDDAINLATALKINIEFQLRDVHASHGDIHVYEDTSKYGSDAVCWAITKVAAQIGRRIA